MCVNDFALDGSRPKSTASTGLPSSLGLGLDLSPVPPVGASQPGRWVGHGFPGGLELDGLVIDAARLDDPACVQSLKARLGGASALELLSCFVASGPGRAFVRKLARALGVPVHASSRAVGPAHLGGTYFLDFGYCPIEERQLPGYEAASVQGLNSLLPLLTVPFTNGFIGQRGSNNQQNDGINTFADMGIDRAFFSQNSTQSVFLAGDDLPGFQGNDIPGFVTLEIAGETFVIEGFIGWQDKDGGKTQIFGFLPTDDSIQAIDHSTKGADPGPDYDPQFVDHEGSAGTVEWVAYGRDTLGPDNNPWTSNFGFLALNGDQAFQAATYVTAADVQGSADLKDVLAELNSYLTYTQNQAPSGPVTVDVQSTLETQPTLTGTVTLQPGETFTVMVDGALYTLGEDAALSLTSGDSGSLQTWELDLTGVQTLDVGTTYEVQATITDAEGSYSRTDSSIEELSILGPGSVTVNDITVNEGSVAGALFTVNAPANDVLALSLSDGDGSAGSGDATGVATQTTDNGDQDYITAFEYYDEGLADWQPYSSPVTVGPSGALYVRVALIDDTANEGAHYFQLTAVNQADGGLTDTGLATILDDGRGTMFEDAPPPPAEAPSAVKDDDRPLTVSNIDVNEASPYAVFLVSGAAGQLASLDLPATGTATIAPSASADYGSGLEYWDATANDWLPYSSGTVALDENGDLLVRTPLVDDDIADDGETFDLVATNTGGTSASGTATIRDNGTGTVYPDLAPTDGSTAAEDGGATLDDDGSLSVSALTINEASNYAVFTLDAAEGLVIDELELRDGETSGIGDNSIEVWSETDQTWQSFGDASTATVGSSGVLFVRVSITEEQDDTPDNGETFSLLAGSTRQGPGEGPTGTATITDDGTGVIFSGDIDTETGTPAQSSDGLDTDPEAETAEAEPEAEAEAEPEAEETAAQPEETAALHYASCGWTAEYVETGDGSYLYFTSQTESSELYLPLSETATSDLLLF